MKITEKGKRLFQAEGRAFWKDTFHKVTAASGEYGKDSGGHESKRVLAKILREKAGKIG